MPVTPTYVPLGTIDVSSASSVVFSSIPATYRDLIVVSRVSGSSTSNVTLRFNSDSGSNYSVVRMFGVPSGAGSGAYTSTAAATGNLFSGDQTISIAQIMDYSQTDKHKTVLARVGARGTDVFASAVRWANTNAINQVQVIATNSSTLTGTVSIYGIH